jgi:hypothetical protein
VVGQQNTTLDNGSSVSQWTDLSGNGYSLTQSLSTKPTFSTSGLNGKNTVSFNGNSNLYSDNFTELTTDNYTILVVTQLDNSTGGDQALLSMTNVSANAGLGITKTSWGGHRWIVLHRMPK